MTANPRQAPSYAHWTLLYVQWTHRHVPMLRACHAAFCTTPHIRESRQAEYAAHGWHRKRTVSSSRSFPPARGSFPQYASAWCSATWTAIRLPYFPANREHVGSNPLPQSSQRSSRYVSAEQACFARRWYQEWRRSTPPRCRPWHRTASTCWTCRSGHSATIR